MFSGPRINKVKRITCFRHLSASRNTFPIEPFLVFTSSVFERHTRWTYTSIISSQGRDPRYLTIGIVPRLGILSHMPDASRWVPSAVLQEIENVSKKTDLKN